MSKVGFVYSDIFLKHIPRGWHPERPERLEAIINRLKEKELWDKLIHIKPIKATFQYIRAVHTQNYIERVKKITSGYLDPDTYISEGSLEAALYAAGAIIEAIKKCRKEEINSAFAAVRPPGHHAIPDRGMGFCIFNNIAIGARYAQSIGYGKVFIVDFDVHHGNGTEYIFYNDDTVFYFSTHQYPHYPGTGNKEAKGSGKGEGYTYNIPMPIGAADKQYEEVYNEILSSVCKSFSPDIILVSAGYDICKEDPLSGIGVTADGIRSIVKGILSAKEGIPVIFTLEGGYDLDALAESVCITIEEMLEKL